MIPSWEMADMAIKKNFVVNTERGLNLRAKPSKKAAVLKVIPYGEKVIVDHDVEAPEGWFAVKDGGFVMKEFLK